MAATSKNKTLATFMAVTLGSIGAHRFYLHGRRDYVGWLHFLALPLSAAFLATWPDQPILFVGLPLVVSSLIALIEALAIGLTNDEKWDARHNPHSSHKSQSGWPLAVLLVLAFGMGAVGLIAAIARGFDLLLTGGAYG